MMVVAAELAQDLQVPLGQPPAVVLREGHVAASPDLAEVIDHRSAGLLGDFGSNAVLLNHEGDVVLDIAEQLVPLLRHGAVLHAHASPFLAAAAACRASTRALRRGRCRLQSFGNRSTPATWSGCSMRHSLQRFSTWRNRSRFSCSTCSAASTALNWLGLTSQATFGMPNICLAIESA